MKRRTFLRYSAAGMALPFMFKGQVVKAIGGQNLFSAMGSMNPSRKLVLLQMNGGYDGLNMLIPISQYTNLYNARPNILIPENQIVKLTDATGLHPSLTALANLYTEKKVEFIQGVGYPNPNLSHFRSKDIVLSASDAQTYINTGWLGRLLDQNYPGFPTGYPNATAPHPIALSIGSTSSQAFQGSSSNFSTVLQSLSLSYLAGDKPEIIPETPFGNELLYVSEMMKQTEAYLDSVSAASNLGRTLSAKYPAAGTNTLADQLKMVARLIDGGLSTQIYILNLGSWDTHSGQVTSSTDKLTGKMPSLMQKLALAISAFQDDMKLLGREDDVLGMVFTEFGRRIKSNNSNGTDHGTTWPAILFGSKVRAGITGVNPVIGSQVSRDENLPLQVDFRSLYTSVYSQWFGLPQQEIASILGGSFNEIRILAYPTSVQDSLTEINHGLKIYPNPANEQFSLEFEASQGSLEVQLITLEGRIITTLYKGAVLNENIKLSFVMPELSSGLYLVSLVNNNRKVTSPIVISR